MGWGRVEAPGGERWRTSLEVHGDPEGELSGLESRRIGDRGLWNGRAWAVREGGPPVEQPESEVLPELF